MRVAALGLCLLLAGCSSDAPSSAASRAPAVETSRPSASPVDDLSVSPPGFRPALRLSVPAGWVSQRRGDDAFDLVRGGITVAFVVPPDPTADEALANLGSRVGGNDVTRQVGGLTARGLQVDGGDGLLLESPGGTVVVPRAPQVTVLALDLEDAPLLVVVVGALSREVDELLNGVRAG